MYGFNKVNAGANQQSAGNPSPANDIWEFKHPDFERGCADKLHLIKRKASTAKMSNSGMLSKTSSQLTVGGDDFIGADHVAFLGNKVQELEEKLEKLNESHSLLWAETVACRVLQSKHHQVIGNAISFLSGIYRDEEGGDTSAKTRSKKRKLDGKGDERLNSVVDILQAELQRCDEDGKTLSNASGSMSHSYDSFSIESLSRRESGNSGM
jgi:hypothetical protein